MPKVIKILLTAVILVCFLLFLFYTYKVYSPWPPFDTSKYEAGLNWIKENTMSDSIFLVLPPISSKQFPIVQQERAIYLGHPVYAEIFGLPWKERFRKAKNAYFGKEIPIEVDYIFYGPQEKYYFPNFKSKYPLVYSDEWVKIYKVR
jgi:hypothetical protein